MRKFTIVFFRIPNPASHSHAFLSSSALSFNTLASNPDAAEVGACKPAFVMGGFETSQQANVRKARELVSLHKEIPISITERKSKERPSSAKAKRKAKTVELQDSGAFKAEDVIAQEEEEAENAASGKGKEAALHAEEKAVHNTTIDANAKEEFSEWVAKLDLETFKRGCEWEKVAYKLLDHGISSAHVKKMLPRCRLLSCRKSAPDSTLEQFAMLGMSHQEMGRMISRWPAILNVSSNLFQSKMEFFESMGIGRQSFGEIICKFSPTLGLSLSNLREHFDFWKDYLQDVQEDAFRILITRNPEVLGMSLQKAVKPRIAYLEELGLSKKMMLTQSTILKWSPKAITMKLKLLEEIGIPGVTSVKTLVALHRVSAPKLHAQLHILFALGFSLDQVRKIMATNPNPLVHSEDRVVSRLSYAVNVMNLSLDAMVRFTAFWGFSMKRIKYRDEVMQELKALGAYEKDISMPYMLNMTDADFSRRFVSRLGAYRNHTNI